MGHELNATVRRVEMAYAGKLPWHSLGTYVGDRNVDSRTMIEAAGLGWRIDVSQIAAVRYPILGADGQVMSWSEPGQVEADGSCAIVRRDCGRVLGTCKDGYTPVQNEERFAFLDSLHDEGAIKYHTAGALFHGKRVWALIELDGSFTVKRRDGSGDVHAPFLLLVGGNDGQNSELITPTGVRVVCWNTTQAALSEAGAHGGIWRLKHTAGIKAKLETARAAITGAHKAIAAQVETFQGLEAERMDRADFVRFSLALLLSEAEEAAVARAEAEKAVTDAGQDGIGKRTENQVADLLELFERGIGNQGETRYDAANAVSEWIDHQRSRAKKAVQTIEQLSRQTESAWTGTGSDRKSRAVKLLARW